MAELVNHKRMLLDIVNRDYINCEKQIYHDHKKCDHIELYGDEPVSSGRIKMFLNPHNISGEIRLCIEQDHCRYINDFTTHWIHDDDHFDSFLRENFTVYDNPSSIEMFQEYVSKISYFISDFPSDFPKLGKRILNHKNNLNGIDFRIMLWTVRKFVSSTEIQVEYNISLSLKENNNDSVYSSDVLGITIENGVITEDFYNSETSLSYFSVDDLVFKTFFALHPKLNTVENNTFDVVNPSFTKELCDRMVLVDKMCSI
jgi:hypothetical protein